MARKSAIAMAAGMAMLLGYPAGAQVYEAGKDTYAARIFQEFFGGVRLNPRQAAMGAYAAHSRGLDSLTGNPAGLAEENQVGLEFYGGMYQLSGDMSYNGMLGTLQGGRVIPGGDADGNFFLYGTGVAIPIEDLFSLGIGFQLIDSDKERDDLMNWDHQTGIFYAVFSKMLSDTVSIGYRLGYQFTDRDGSSHNRMLPTNAHIPLYSITDRYSSIDWDRTWLNTLGINWTVSETVRMGMMIDYSFAQVDLKSRTIFHLPSGDQSLMVKRKGDAQEFGLRGGVSWEPTENTLLAMDLGFKDRDWDYDSYRNSDGIRVSAGDEEGDEVTLALGIEQGITDWLALRGGFQYFWTNYENTFTVRPYKANLDYPVWSGGFGLYFGTLTLDYVLAYTHEADGDFTNMGGLSLRF